MSDIERSAVFSPGLDHRYTLDRRWGPQPMLAFVMLNPSIADEVLDDPTVTRCMGFARRDGFGGITVRNLFAFRTPSPRVLANAHRGGVIDVIGSDNDDYLRALVIDPAVGGAVAAWGKGSSLPKSLFEPRVEAVLGILGSSVSVLDAKPFRGAAPHPLYLKTDTQLIPYPAMP